MKSAFGAFVLKELFHILRDARTMMILLGMPIAQMLIFGFAISTEVRNVKVGVLNSGKDPFSSRIIEQLDASSYLSIDRFYNTPEEVDQSFRAGDIDLCVVFPNRFESDLTRTNEAKLQLLANAEDPNYANMSTNIASAIIRSAFQEKISDNAPIKEQGIATEVRMLYNPQMKSAYNFVPGVMGLILMLICAMMTSLSIVREKERGTMEVLLVSPISPITVLIAKIIPYLLLSFVNLVSILLLSVFVLGVPIAGNIFSLLLLSIIYLIGTLGLGIFISSVVQQQVIAMMISGIVLIMPTMLLSGMIFPIESMPQALQIMSLFIPARWYIEAVKIIMIEGLPLAYASKQLIILSVIALLLTGVSLKKFKKRLE